MDTRILKRKETCKRRKLMDCKVFILKLDKSHLSKQKTKYLNNLFLETKWFYNDILSKDIFKYDSKVRSVISYDKDMNPISRELISLSSQMKQAICQRTTQNVVNLSKTEAKERGRLKFKSEVKSIPLKQFNVTYRFKNNRLYLQGFRKSFKIQGLNQIPEGSEIANAILIKKGNDYYLNITCYSKKEIIEYPNEEIGIDFGIKTNLTLSNGETFNVNIPESEKTRYLRKQLKNKIKYSNNYKKQYLKINRSKEKELQKKKDAKNKIVSYLVRNFKTICIQDENIKGWKDSLFGKQVHNSILGGIILDLKRKSNTLKLIDRYEPTTKKCSNCGNLKTMKLSDREYKCEICKISLDRDLNSALNILKTGKGLISSKPVEESIPASGCVQPFVNQSLTKQEAT